MASILEAIRNVLCAAVMYNIPRQILSDRVKGYVTHGSLLGSGYYLSNCEENELAEWMSVVCVLDYGEYKEECK